MKRLDFTCHFDINYYKNNRPEINFHSHTHYEIFYFHAGRCNYLIGDQIYTLVPGDLIIMNGMTLHRPKLFENEQYCRSTVHFDANYFKNVLGTMKMERLLQPFTTLQSYRIHLREKEQIEINGLLKRMNHLSSSKDDVSQWLCQLVLLELITSIYQIFQKPLKNISEPPSEKESHVQRLISFLEQNYMKPLNMEILEKSLHISKYYLSKVFKEVTGVTIFNYLYQRRINQAKIEFLISPEKSVTEVCYSVGFKHPSHFSKIFKQLVGCTPEAFKREQAKCSEHKH